MTIIHKQGNLLEAEENILGHQTNCIGVMGGGIALQIKNKYPEVYASYRKLCKKSDDIRRYDMSSTLLGQAQMIEIGEKKFIANIFGQEGFGRNKTYTNYDALKNGLISIKMYAEKNEFSVALPYLIGCHLAGGDWNIVHPMIEEVFEDYSVTLYEFNPEVE